MAAVGRTWVVNCRTFKFSIREIILLTAIVALALGWWRDHRRLTSTAEGLHQNLARVDGNFFQIVAALNAKGAGITKDAQSGHYVLPGPPGPARSRIDGSIPEDEGPLPPGLKRATGPFTLPTQLPNAVSN